MQRVQMLVPIASWDARKFGEFAGGEAWVLGKQVLPIVWVGVWLGQWLQFPDGAHIICECSAAIYLSPAGPHYPQRTWSGNLLPPIAWPVQVAGKQCPGITCIISFQLAGIQSRLRCCQCDVFPFGDVLLLQENHFTQCAEK